MRFPTSHRWTVYVTLKSPKGWHKTQICYFSSKIQILSKKVEKILRQSFFVWKLVATSFLCLAVHRWIAGNVPICLKFALKVTHPSKNADFDRFRLTVPHPRELARKVQLSIIGSRHTRFPSSHRWTLCVTPKSPKGDIIQAVKQRSNLRLRCCMLLLSSHSIIYSTHCACFTLP